MVPELEKPRVTEIQVRMDCNGCVHKLKKALHGINGIYDIHIDFPQQKLIIIGWADTEKIVKAIRKTRKIIGSVCVHTDESSEAPPQGSEQPPPLEGEQPLPPNTESPPNAENNPQPEPPNDPPPPVNPALEIHPSLIAAEANEGLPLYHSMPRDVEEIHVIHHRQRDYNGRFGNYPPENHQGYWSNYPPKGHGFRPQPPVYSHGSRHEPPVYLHASRPEPLIYSHGTMTEPPVYSHRFRPEPPIYSQGPMPEPPPVYSHRSRPELPIYSHGSRPEPPVYVHGSRHEPHAPAYVTHSYNNYTPTPSVSEYEYVQPPLRQPRSNRMEHYYNEDYYNRDSGYQNSDNRNGNNITSIFSDENPNACRIV